MGLIFFVLSNFIGLTALFAALVLWRRESGSSPGWLVLHWRVVSLAASSATNPVKVRGRIQHTGCPEIVALLAARDTRNIQAAVPAVEQAGAGDRAGSAGAAGARCGVRCGREPIRSGDRSVPSD